MFTSLLIRRNAIKSISNYSLQLPTTAVAVASAARADSLLSIHRFFADEAKKADTQSSRSSIDERLNKLNQQREKLAKEAVNEDSSANTKPSTTGNDSRNNANASQDKSPSSAGGDAKQSRPYSKVQWSEPSSRSHVSELIRKGVVDPNAAKSKRSAESDSQDRERRQNYRRDDRSKSVSSGPGRPQRPRREEQQFHGISAESLAKIQEQMRKEELEEKEWMPKENHVDLAKYSENDKMLSSRDLVKNIKSDHIQKARRHALDTGSSESQSEFYFLFCFFVDGFKRMN